MSRMNKARGVVMSVALAIGMSVGLAGCSTGPQADETVLAFMEAVQEGKAADAVELGGLNAGGSPLMTNEVYQAATGRPTGAKVVSSESPSKNEAVVKVEYTQDGSTYEGEFALSKGGDDADDPDAWKIDSMKFGDASSPLMSAVTIDAPQGRGALTVNGVALELGDNSVYMALPGTYTFQAGETTLLQAWSEEVPVALSGATVTIEQEINEEAFLTAAGELWVSTIEECANEAFELQCTEADADGVLEANTFCQSLLNTEFAQQTIRKAYSGRYYMPSDATCAQGEELSLSLVDPLEEFATTSCTASQCIITAGQGTLELKGVAKYLRGSVNFTDTLKLSDDLEDPWFITEFVVTMEDGETLMLAPIED